MNVNRRDFLKLSLLSASAMTFAACGRPVEHGLVSQYQMPEYKLPGQSVFWASTCADLRSDCAVSVKTVENRAINVLGTPGHFFSRGAVTSTAVSSLQTLYHPGRISKALGFPEDAVLADFVADLLGKAKGSALFVVDRLYGSLGNAIVHLARGAGAKIWVADSHHSMVERRVLKQVVGRAELPFYPLESRDFLLTVGSNMLAQNYAPTRTGWAYGRFRKTPGRLRGRMVSFSSRMNASDANSDLWVPVKPGSEPYVLAALGSLLSAEGRGDWPAWATVTMAEAVEKTGVLEDVFVKLAARLAEASAPLVVGGFEGVHGEATVFLAHSLTNLLTGDVPTFEPDLLLGEKVEGADLFVDDREAATMLASAALVLVNQVDVVYRYPWLAQAFDSVKAKVVLATTSNDTTAKASHVVPLRSWLEDWADLRVASPDGDWYGVTQPAVSLQVSGAQSQLGFFLQMAKASGLEFAAEVVRPKRFLQGDRDGAVWEDMLARGGVWPSLDEQIYPSRANYPPPPIESVGEAPEGYSVYEDVAPLEVSSFGEAPNGMVFLPLPTHLGDGALSDRPWMQELPDAMTTVVWDSWIEINEDVAKGAKIERHDLVEVKTSAGSIVGSAIPSPFIHPEVIGIPKGRGHDTKPPKVFTDIGWESDGSNPMKLLSGQASSLGYFQSVEPGVSITKKAGSKLLATFDQRVYNLPRHILPD